MQGIYVIKNNHNSKCYIGSSTRIYTRWEAHQSSSSNSELREDMKKYGVDAFELKILEEVKDSALLPQCEQFWLDVHMCNHELYNSWIIVDSAKGAKRKRYKPKPEMFIPDPLLKPEQAANMLGITLDALKELDRNGQLKPIRIFTVKRYPTSAIESFQVSLAECR